MEYSTRFDIFRGDTGYYYRLIFSGDLAYGPAQPSDPVKDEIVNVRPYKTAQNAFAAGMLKLEQEGRHRMKARAARVRARLAASNEKK